MQTSYDPVAKTLHWLVFLLIAIELTLAWTMPEADRLESPTTLVGLHFSFGILILGVIIIRLLWRITHRAPALPLTMPRWMKFFAHLTHYVFYAILIILPFLGWVWASAYGFPVIFFGIVEFPPLCEIGSELGLFIGELHKPLGTFLAWLIGFHILAALYHHFIVKDGILTRMLPSRGQLLIKERQ